MRPLLRLEEEQHYCAISGSYFWTTPKSNTANFSITSCEKSGRHPFSSSSDEFSCIGCLQLLFVK